LTTVDCQLLIGTFVKNKPWLTQAAKHWLTRSFKNQCFGATVDKPMHRNQLYTTVGCMVGGEETSDIKVLLCALSRNAILGYVTFNVDKNVKVYCNQMVDTFQW